MKAALDSVKRFLISDDGPTAVEYAFMAGFIIAVCVAAIGNLGTATNDYFERTKDAMN